MRKRRKKTAAVVAPGMGKSPPHTPAPTDAPRSDQAICDAGTRTRLCLQDGARGGAGARFSTLRERGCGRKRRRAAAAAARMRTRSCRPLQGASHGKGCAASREMRVPQPRRRTVSAAPSSPGPLFRSYYKGCTLDSLA
jgi:hypothetical protein